MDLDKVDPRSLDVAHEIDNFSFRFYSETEALSLSVRRLTSPYAFDELGIPISRGLYDPALGPTSYDQGPCVTCGLSYNHCPGHFGHIEMPFPLANPLLGSVILRILRSSCWHCMTLRSSPTTLKLLLARLYFEDAGLHEAGYAVEAFRILKGAVRKQEDNVESVDKLSTSIVTNWTKFLSGLPKPLCNYVNGLGMNDGDRIVRNMLRAAKHAWKKARTERRLRHLRSSGWKEAESVILTDSGACARCRKRRTKVRAGTYGRLFKVGLHQDTLLSPTEIETHVKTIWQEHAEIFELLYGLKGRERMAKEERPGHMRLFVRVVLVPPSRFRPTSVVGNMSYAAEHPQNMFFHKLLEEIEIIMSANNYGLEGEDIRENSDNEGPVVERPTKARFAKAMSDMQEALRSLYDSKAVHAKEGRIQTTGIRQQLEAKAGLFRQHMMGKRVNYSCRSVIGPDAFLDTNEIGIPESFAKMLTVPEAVTPTNLAQMQRAVLNGPDVYPGAMAVEDWTSNGDHRVIKFRSSDQVGILNAQAGLLIQNRIPNGTQKSSSQMVLDMHSDDVAGDSANVGGATVPKRVHRHLKTGDIVLFNRQPTLHRVSIMAHKVRVLPGDRTIRFHYANCGSYNADFDGDEMNVHVPQDYLARAEAEELMLSSRHYIVPTSGAPIRGLIQDHIAASTLLSRRDMFLDRETFIQLLHSATEKLMLRRDRVCKKHKLPQPAILHPKALWTGKQLISAVLYVVRNGRPGINLEAGSKTKANIVGKEESSILIRQGELLRGIVDKSSLGSSMYGIVHAVQEAYGWEASDDFLTAMSRLCLYFMRRHGHTTGVDDLVLQEKGDRARADIINSSLDNIAVDVTNEVYSQMNKGNPERLPKAKTIFEARHLVEDMIRNDGAEAEDRLDSGMKSALNKVSSNVMKACVPASLKKCFPGNGFALMTNTGAKGGPVNSAQISCLLGSTVLEGKRVPRMGGGATLPCFMPFDASPLAGGFIASRFLTGITPQEFFFHAMSGREGLLDTSLKTANSGYLQRCLVKHLEGVQMRYDGSVRDSDDSVLQFIYGDDGIDPSKSRWLNERVDWQLSNKTCLPVVECETDSKVVAQQRKQVFNNVDKPCCDTLLEKVSPGALARRGAISEKFYASILDETKGSGAEKKWDRKFLEARYQQAALEPGEAVGILAAQGVGEPSTQMTLNTFHHAGSSSAHVTLGIPRLRELLMTAAKYPNTPSMTFPVIGEDEEAREKAALEFSRKLQCVRLIDLLLQIEIHELSIEVSPMLSKGGIRTVRLKMQLPPEKVYAKQLGITFKSFASCMRKTFLPMFHTRLKGEISRAGSLGAKRKTRATRIYLNSAGNPFSQSRWDDSKKVEDELMDETILPRGDEIEVERNEGGYESSSGEEDEEDEKTDDEEGGVKKEDMQLKNEDEEVLDGEDSANGKDVKKKEGKNSEQKERRKTIDDGALLNGGDKANEDGGSDSEDIEYGSLGYVCESLKFEDGKTICFDWALCTEFVGSVNIGAVLKETAANTKLSHVERISKCFIDKENEKCCVITEGSNIVDILELGYNLVDFDRLETNDMFGILDTYGVEALRTALIEEFVKVFDAYGIPVNIRHLYLIADYMTAHGGYRGFNRLHMMDTPSPFQRMTFETSMKFLTESALNTTDECVKNPSAVIALGQIYKGGTGGFQLIHQSN